MKKTRLSLSDFESSNVLDNQKNLMTNIRGGEEDKKDEDKKDEKTGPHMLVKGYPTMELF